MESEFGYGRKPVLLRRLLDGDAMTEVWRISASPASKIGYKIVDCYKEHGLEALTDRYRRLVCYANLLSKQVA